MAASNEQAFDNFTKAMSHLGYAFENALRSFAHLAVSWQYKLSDETWDEYLERVPDALDNPEIRWEYQKHIWAIPYRWAKRRLDNE